MVLNRVVLPTPFGPMMPTMPPRGIVNDRSPMRTRSPKPLVSAFASMTMEPSRGPAGIWISSKSSFLVFSASAAISSYRASRLLLLVCRPLAFWRTHSSSSLRRLESFASFLPCTSSRCCFFSRYVE